MMQHDLGHWPLVVSVSRGAPTHDDLLAYSDDWSRWLDSHERFAILRIHADAASHTYPEGGAQEKKRWFQENGSRVTALVIGMATVVPSEMLEEVSRIKLHKLYGVPAQAFDNVDDALAWLLRLMHEQGKPLQAAPLREKACALLEESAALADA